MNNELISIIIPVYNVEQYIESCIKSCISQVYKNNEILLIDDGSNDNSGIICDEFAKKYDNIKCYHKENGGLSDARNYGIEQAQGKYIMFVDSDDIVDKNILLHLYNCINLNDDASIAVCNLTHFENEKDIVFNYSNQNICYLQNEALKNFLYQNLIPTSACGKLYKKELLISKNIRFIKGQRFEDNYFVFRILSNSNSVIYTPEKLYAYRHRINSITTSNFSEKDFDIIDIGKVILKEVEYFNDDIKKAAIIYQYTNCLRIYLTITKEYTADNRYSYSKKYLDYHTEDVIKNKNVRLKLKAGLFLYKIHFPRKLMIFIRNKKNRWN